jgi:hypothetical protein
MGKSTLLQAIALTLVGPLAGQRLLRPEGWVRKGRSYGELDAELIKGDQDSQLGQPRKRPYTAKFAITGNEEVELDGRPYDQPQLVQRNTDGEQKALSSGPYAARRPGWFCCGYGPFRRLSGGDAAESRLIYSTGREARFATLFREAAALTQCTDWLTSLYSRSNDPGHPDRERAKEGLEAVRHIIDGLLPGGVGIARIDSEHVYFHTVGGAEVPVPDLSDGYRSFLALGIDMLRHLQEAGFELPRLIQDGPDGLQVLAEGIVLIDEVDAHLHPVWQREIGFRLRRAFPKVQFVVTSHSPFVAQAASDGGLIVLRPAPGGVVHAVRPVESVRGWRVDQILTSPLFGLTGTRDEETEGLLRRHEALVAKRPWQELSGAERAQLAELEAKLAERLTLPGETAAERDRQSKMARYVEETLQRVGERP